LISFRKVGTIDFAPADIYRNKYRWPKLLSTVWLRRD
jgi:hypothetical protein